MLYNLGVCAERQDQNEEAARFWEECVQNGGEETRNAALALAALRLKGPKPETALEMLVLVADKTAAGRGRRKPAYGSIGGFEAVPGGRQDVSG